MLFQDAAIAPLGGPLVDVVATAKVDIEAESVLDRIGGYLTYGQAENASVAGAERLLPLGVAEGARVVRRVAKDEVLTYDDVELPPDRVSDSLRAEQAERFGLTAPR